MTILLATVAECIEKNACRVYPGLVWFSNAPLRGGGAR